jgi:hypothetical protein
MLPEDSPQLGRWPEFAANVNSWMEHAKRIAVAGYRQVLEDGPGVCNSKSDADYSDHGQKWPDEAMCTPDMTAEKRNPDLSRERLTTELVNALRAAGREAG